MCQNYNIKKDDFLSLMSLEHLTSHWKCLGARAPTGASFLTCLQRCTTPSTWTRYIRCDRVNSLSKGQCVGKGGPPGQVFLDTQLSEQNTETGADRRSTETQELPSVNSRRKGGNTGGKEGGWRKGGEGGRLTAWWRMGTRKEWTAEIQAVTSHHCGHSSGPLSLCHQATIIISGSK